MHKRKPSFSKIKGGSKFGSYIVCTFAEKKTASDGSKSTFESEVDRIYLSKITKDNGNLVILYDNMEIEGNELIETLVNNIGMSRNTFMSVDNFSLFLGCTDFVDSCERNFYFVNKRKVTDYLSQFGFGEEVEVSNFACSGPPNYIILESQMYGFNLTVCDIANYLGGSSSGFAAEIKSSEECAEFIESNSPYSNFADLLRHWINTRILIKILQVYRDIGLSEITLTPASAAMRIFRSKCNVELIKPHVNKDAALHELHSYNFGRTDQLWHGQYNGKCYLLDVQGMYPSIAASEQFPVELIDYGMALPVKSLEGNLGNNEWIIRAIVKTDCPAYFSSNVNKHIFPIGTFETYLTGKEVDYAFMNNEIVEILEYSRYRTYPILEEFANYLLNKRYEYRTDREKIDDIIIKTVINCIWGKFAAPGSTWVEIPERYYPDAFACFVEINDRTKEERFYRVINHVVYELNKLIVSDNTFPAISSTIAGLGRNFIWYLISKAGAGNLLYSCVDGIIVNQEGYERLCRYIDNSPSGFGFLKVSEEADFCVINGYGNYRIGKKYVAIGYNPDKAKRYKSWHNTKLHRIPLSLAQQRKIELIEQDMSSSEDVYNSLEYSTVCGQRLDFPVLNNGHASENIPFLFLDQLHLHFDTTG